MTVEQRKEYVRGICESDPDGDGHSTGLELGGTCCQLEMPALAPTCRPAARAFAAPIWRCFHRDRSCGAVSRPGTHQHTDVPAPASVDVCGADPCCTWTKAAGTGAGFRSTQITHPGINPADALLGNPFTQPSSFFDPSNCVPCDLCPEQLANSKNAECCPDTATAAPTPAPSDRPVCPGDLVHNECGSACPEACNVEPAMVCVEVCVSGCGCPAGQVLVTGKAGETRCTRRDKCPETLPFVPDYTVVGAGPGGVTAAHVLSQLSGKSVVQFERGELPLDGTYSSLSFAQTFQAQSTYQALTLNGETIDLAGVYGGQQTTNGGVYAPGLPEELAEALAINVGEAAAAQQCARSAIETSPARFDAERLKDAANVRSVTAAPSGLHTVVFNDRDQTEAQIPNSTAFTAVCVGGADSSGDGGDGEGCVWGDRQFNQNPAENRIRRRTVAHGLHGPASPAYTRLNTTVDHLVFQAGDGGELAATGVVFSDGTVSAVAEGGSVILAAGALGSAAVLAKSAPEVFGGGFKMFNHYYTVAYCVPDPPGVPCPLYEPGPHNDAWFSEIETAGDPETDCKGQRFEIEHYGNFPKSSGIVQLVLLQMEPEMRGDARYNPATDLIDVAESPTACDTLNRGQAVNMTIASWGNIDGAGNFFSATFGAFWAQSWHFAGGIPTAPGSSRVLGTANVHTADTGALRKPFNCHTSMPSAAAGIRAAMELVGDPVDHCAKFFAVVSTLREGCSIKCSSIRGRRHIPPI